MGRPRTEVVYLWVEGELYRSPVEVAVKIEAWYMDLLVFPLESLLTQRSSYAFFRLLPRGTHHCCSTSLCQTLKFNTFGRDMAFYLIVRKHQVGLHEEIFLAPTQKGIRHSLRSLRFSL